MSEYNINKIELPNGDICHLKDEETQILKNDKVSIVDINSNITKGIIPSSDIWTSILYRYENGTSREQSNRLFSIDGVVRATTGENALMLSVYKNEANSTYSSYLSINYSSNPYAITNGSFYALGNMYSGESTATSDRIIKTESNSGAISLYSTGNTNGNGNRGIYLYAHGTGSGKSIITADTDNNISYTGGTFLTKITQARAGEATISVKNTNYNHEVALTASSATSQSAGVYDLTNSKWLIYSDSTGAVYVNGLSYEAKKLSLYEARANTTTLNKAVNYGGAGAMLHLVATSSTATTNNGKPPFGDSNILQMNWDNNGEYDAQLAISTAGTSSEDNTLSLTRMEFRGRSSTNSPWREVVTIKPGAAIGSTNQPAYITAEGRAYGCSTVGVSYGGTGATTSSGALENLGINQLLEGKIDIDQGTTNVGKTLIVGNDGNVTPGDANIPAAVTEALLACFRNVAWINWQESGQSFYNALEDALGVHTMSYGVYEPEELINGQYIDTDGQIKTGTVGQSYYIADYIPVVESSYWIAVQPFIARTNKNSKGTVTSIYSQTNWRVSEYDANKTFIKQTHYEMANYTEYNARVVTFDPNTRYIRLGWNDGNAAVHVFDIEPPHSFSVLPMELGNIDASTGNNTTNSLRIRTNGYIPVTGNTITLIGCPFADSWLALNPNSVYGIRCYDANKNYLGTLQNLPASDIEDYPLLTNTAYIRMIMQYNALVNFSGFSKLVNHLFTVNGTKYYVTEV